MRIGITGHQRLKDPSGWDWVQAQIDSFLNLSNKPLIGVTSLAIGADQHFAEAVLRHGGVIEAVIPFEGYELKFDGKDRQQYLRLLNLASKVNVLPKIGTDEEAYFEAGKRIVDDVDVLVAVWDGKPAAGLGGTADVVNYARQKRRRIMHFNPTTQTTENL